MPSAYQKHVAVWEFTGTWCAFCPKGYDNLNFVISRNDAYAERVHVMAFHSSSTGHDPMSIPEASAIMNALGIGDEFPSYALNMNLHGSLSDILFVSDDLRKDALENPVHCGVACSSRIVGNEANVEIKVISEREQVYRVAVFVVEDGIVAAQTLPSGVNENYVHDHVVRRVVSSTFRGDRIGEIPHGKEASVTYNVALSGDWKIENTYIYALAVNESGCVNNMNICSIDGGNSPYRLK